MSLSDQTKPLPQPTKYSTFYWEAAGRHELWVQRCTDCQTHRHYPRPCCPKCLSPRLEWVQAAGTGTVYAFSVVFRPLSRAFLEDVPYVFALVDLDENVRMVSIIIDCAPEEVYIGMPVEVVFEDVAPQVALSRFRPRT
ncbi:Zn-ribbon domain-containing OB-fold protein [Thermodesulfobacteriota bacterium]